MAGAPSLAGALLWDRGRASTGCQRTLTHWYAFLMSTRYYMAALNREGLQHAIVPMSFQFGTVLSCRANTLA